jgi:hypothetical protein
VQYKRTVLSHADPSKYYWCCISSPHIHTCSEI